MQEDSNLTLAAPADLADALSYALCFDGRRRAHQGDELMARITAERLVAHLARSGFVVMKKPPGRPHGPSQPPAPRG